MYVYILFFIIKTFLAESAVDIAMIIVSLELNIKSI